MSDIRFVFNNENKTDTLAPCSRCGEPTDDVEYLRGIGDGKLYCRPCSLSGPGFRRLLQFFMEHPEGLGKPIRLFDDEGDS